VEVINMAGAVGAAVGVVSTVAGMGEQSRQRNIQRQQAQVQQYAQEVQYEQEKQAIKHQREFANQTRQLEDIQLAAQDKQMSNALTEQALQARTEEAQLGYQLELKGVQDESALRAANQALDLAEYQQGELYRQRTAQGLSRQSETAGQLNNQSAELQRYLTEGNSQQAAALLMNASMGQSDSKSSQITTDRKQEIANGLRTLMEQGTLTQEAVRQALYEEDIAATLEDAGLLDIALERIGAQTQFDVNKSMNSAQKDLLQTGKRKNAIGENLAQSTLAGGMLVRDTQRNIDKAFGDMGYTSQVDNAGIRNAGLMSSLQAQQASNSGSLFTTLANTAALGGSLYNAYQQMQPVTSYSSPVRGGNTTTGMNTPAKTKASSSGYYGPAYGNPSSGYYGPAF
jgi:hypothetical protein